MSAKVAGSAVRHVARRKVEDRTEIDEAFLRATGERVVATLGDLKGGAMKVGQMMSQAGTALPDELTEALARLQRDAPPADYSVIARQIEAEFGAPPERLFARIDPEPFAAASIGQVHRATTDDGREVVVKVQYPGVDASVASDLAAVRRTLKLVQLGTPLTRLDETFGELHDVLQQELDYCVEADNLRRLRALHDEEWLLLPEVVPERSSGRVITLTYVPGADLATAASWTEAERDRLGQRLAQLTARQLFAFGFMHGDPHPGNFAFRRDGSVVLYDFGCVREYDLEARSALFDLLLAARGADVELADDVFVRLGLRHPDRPSPGRDLYGPMLELLARPLHGPHRFSQAADPDDLWLLSMEFMASLGSFSGGGSFGVIKRQVAGLFDTLRVLDATVDLWAEAEAVRPPPVA